MVLMDKEVLIDFYKRYDQMGYQVFGISECWYLRKTIQLLTSFSLEVNGQFGNEHTLATYDALFSEYMNYISNLLFSDRIPYHCDEEPTPDYEDTKSIDIDNTYFKQDDLLTYIENNNSLEVDVARLKRFLIGVEAPDFKRGSKSISELIERKYNVVDGIAQVPSKDEVSDVKFDHSPTDEYKFVKNGNSWNIRFGVIELNNLKDFIGMNYIKILLQDPYNEIGVFDIQNISNPDYIQDSDSYRRKDKLMANIDNIEDEPYDNSEEDEIRNELDGGMRKTYDYHVDEPVFGNVDYTLAKLIKGLSADKKKQVTTLYFEIGKLKSDQEEATKNNNTIEASRLTSLLSMLGKDMYDVVYSRSDDPEVESNRKKVYKNIEDARKKIQEAEISAGYTDTPVYNYLKEHIKTGFYCSYFPLADDPIHWMF
jgi:hypothetical protein